MQSCSVVKHVQWIYFDDFNDREVCTVNCIIWKDRSIASEQGDTQFLMT